MDVWREDVPVWGADNTCDCIWGINNLLAECFGQQNDLSNNHYKLLERYHETAARNRRVEISTFGIWKFILPRELLI